MKPVNDLRNKVPTIAIAQYYSAPQIVQVWEVQVQCIIRNIGLQRSLFPFRKKKRSLFEKGQRRQHIFARTAPQAETMACLAALKESVSLHQGSLVVETDCQVLGHFLKGDAADRSELCFLVREICLMASHFQSCNFCWVPRSANTVAHGLAQYARVSNSMENLAGLPPFLEGDATLYSCNSDHIPVNLVCFPFKKKNRQEKIAELAYSKSW